MGWMDYLDLMGYLDLMDSPDLLKSTVVRDLMDYLDYLGCLGWQGYSGCVDPMEVNYSISLDYQR